MVYADVHFHLLPRVDDGPEEMAESVELARAALADGTSTVVCTPHVRKDFVTEPLELVELVRELREALADAGVPLEVRCGGELGHDLVETLGDAQLDAIAQGPAGNRWLLVEAPFDGLTADFRAATAELRERGFGVMIAHPERTAFAETDGMTSLRLELAAGSVAQLNAQSLLGEHGAEARSAAYAYVARGLVGIVASDAHGHARRPSLGAACSALLDAGTSPGRAWALTRARPGRMLNEGLATPPALAAA
jgi:protein-tyrosine phosphatase